MGTVTHAKVSAIADDPLAVAAGEVVPSDWNAGHVLALTKSDVGLGNVDNVSQATILANAATAAAVLYRPKLAADQTKNVPADFATLELALAYAATIDFNGFTLTIQLATGTYTAALLFKVPVTVGQGLPSNLIIQGNTGTPSNCVVVGPANFGGIIEANTGAMCRVQGIQLQGPGSAFGLRARNGGAIEYTACDFNTGLFSGLFSEAGGITTCVGTATFSANMFAGVYASNNGNAFQVGSAVTTANTPAWTAGYAWSDAVSFVQINGATFGGTGATGVRFSVQRNAVIDVSGAGANYLPGNSAGFIATGGIYS